MTRDRPTTAWLRHVRADNGRPIYLALVEALETAVREGELQAGDQLPPQRAVAAQLGVDFTTITRAYGAARDRGLVEGAAGRGTFVRRRVLDDEAGLVDLSMNLPPPPQGVSLAALLKETTAAILDRTDVATLMAYHAGQGAPGQRGAGAAWLAPALGPIGPERIVVSPGAQSALAAILTMVAKPGAGLMVEPLTYPGVIALATRLGLRLIPCPVDAEGFLPEVLARLCAERRPAAVYLVPTTRNPVATTMGLARRREIAAAIGAGDACLIEDDPYSRLFDSPLPALASLAPERTFHIATLSKTLSPGLRTAFVATPTAAMAQQVADALHATALMGSPLATAVAIRWIRDGTAERILAGVRREARLRRVVAAEALPHAQGDAEGLHVWLDLPPGLDATGFRALAAARGLALVASDAFATTPDAPAGLRISLGGPAKASMLRQALSHVATLLEPSDATGPGA
ncbi:PLP-dependent aminotransferase family protein [Caulobacter sp. BK020]|uniref:aminotransferase-like domain-containing protein n=1 Tax=Caulobacter sp. BK020 TaxID=2512117 RepID=UPI0010DF4FF4|nr:PLP-dependent aminotransferase family protein [Caulobacter sp. BK020]TCS14881.1 GntR family transcriptional regulator [Caulobacter sp. BK020]